MKKYRRHFVTLIELLLVVTVLLMVAGVVGISIRKALFEQRFRSEVGMVVNTLRLAQDLMLLLNADIHVLFADAPEGGIKYWLEMEKPLPTNWEREIKRRRANLTAIHLVEMDDKITSQPGKNRLDIKFLSGGSIMSQGMLSLYSGDNKNREDVLVSSICLPGYPQPIKSVPAASKLQNCEGDAAELKEQLTRDMLNELQPLLPKAQSDQQEPDNSEEEDDS